MLRLGFRVQIRAPDFGFGASGFRLRASGWRLESFGRKGWSRLPATELIQGFNAFSWALNPRSRVGNLSRPLTFLRC